MSRWFTEGTREMLTDDRIERKEFFFILMLLKQVVHLND